MLTTRHVSIPCEERGHRWGVGRKGESHAQKGGGRRPSAFLELQLPVGPPVGARVLGTRHWVLDAAFPSDGEAGFIDPAVQMPDPDRLIDLPEAVWHVRRGTSTGWRGEKRGAGRV